MPLGTIILPLRIRVKDKCKIMPIRFTVVDLNFSYNTIIGLPLINKIKYVISPHQLLLQSKQVDERVGILKGSSSIG